MSEQSGQNQVFVGVSSLRWRKGQMLGKTPWSVWLALGIATIGVVYLLGKGRWDSLLLGCIYAVVLGQRAFLDHAPRHLLLTDKGMRLQYDWRWLDRWQGKSMPWDVLRLPTSLLVQGDGLGDALHDVRLKWDKSSAYPEWIVHLAAWLPADSVSKPAHWPESKLPSVPFWRWRGFMQVRANQAAQRKELPARIAQLPLVQALVAQGVQMPPLAPSLDLANLGGMESLDPRRMKAVLGVLLAVLLLAVGAWQVVGPWELLVAGTWLWPVSLLLGIGLGVGMAWWPARRVKADPQSPGSLAGVLELFLLAVLIAAAIWAVQGVWRAAAVAWGSPQVAHYTPVAPQTWGSSASSKRVWTGPAGMPPLVLHQRRRGAQLQPKAIALPVLHTWGGVWQADSRVLDELSR